MRPDDELLEKIFQAYRGSNYHGNEYAYSFCEWNKPDKYDPDDFAKFAEGYLAGMEAQKCEKE
ncbi:MAG: hypothetical protein FWF26_05405 [Treponema sp.]|nr:hypothetical protein [Treponema sp.]